MENNILTLIEMSWEALLKAYQARLHKLCEFGHFVTSDVDRVGKSENTQWRFIILA